MFDEILNKSLNSQLEGLLEKAKPHVAEGTIKTYDNGAMYKKDSSVKGGWKYIGMANKKYKTKNEEEHAKHKGNHTEFNGKTFTEGQHLHHAFYGEVKITGLEENTGEGKEKNPYTVHYETKDGEKYSQKISGFDKSVMHSKKVYNTKHNRSETKEAAEPKKPHQKKAKEKPLEEPKPETDTKTPETEESAAEAKETPETGTSEEKEPEAENKTVEIDLEAEEKAQKSQSHFETYKGSITTAKGLNGLAYTLASALDNKNLTDEHKEELKKLAEERKAELTPKAKEPEPEPAKNEASETTDEDAEKYDAFLNKVKNGNHSVASLKIALASIDNADYPDVYKPKMKKAVQEQIAKKEAEIKAAADAEATVEGKDLTAKIAEFKNAKTEEEIKALKKKLILEDEHDEFTSEIHAAYKEALSKIKPEDLEPKNPVGRPKKNFGEEGTTAKFKTSVQEIQEAESSEELEMLEDKFNDMHKDDIISDKEVMELAEIIGKKHKEFAEAKKKQFGSPEKDAKQFEAFKSSLDYTHSVYGLEKFLEDVEGQDWHDQGVKKKLVTEANQKIAAVKEANEAAKKKKEDFVKNSEASTEDESHYKPAVSTKHNVTGVKLGHKGTFHISQNAAAGGGHTEVQGQQLKIGKTGFTHANFFIHKIGNNHWGISELSSGAATGSYFGSQEKAIADFREKIYGKTVDDAIQFQKSVDTFKTNNGEAPAPVLKTGKTKAAPAKKASEIEPTAEQHAQFKKQMESISNATEPDNAVIGAMKFVAAGNFPKGMHPEHKKQFQAAAKAKVEELESKQATASGAEPTSIQKKMLSGFLHSIENNDGEGDYEEKLELWANKPELHSKMMHPEHAKIIQEAAKKKLAEIHASYSQPTEDQHKKFKQFMNSVNTNFEGQEDMLEGFVAGQLPYDMHPDHAKEIQDASKKKLASLKNQKVEIEGAKTEHFEKMKDPHYKFGFKYGHKAEEVKAAMEHITQNRHGGLSHSQVYESSKAPAVKNLLKHHFGIDTDSLLKNLGLKPDENYQHDSLFSSIIRKGLAKVWEAKKDFKF